jgi:hypothetical protein
MYLFVIFQMVPETVAHLAFILGLSRQQSLAKVYICVLHSIFESYFNLFGLLRLALFWFRHSRASHGVAADGIQHENNGLSRTDRTWAWEQCSRTTGIVIFMLYHCPSSVVMFVHVVSRCPCSTTDLCTFVVRQRLILT